MEWIANFMKTKIAKVGGGVVAGGSSLMIIMNLITTQIQALDKKIDYTVQETHQYVDSKHDLVMSEIGHVRESQAEIKDMLRIIEKRMYDQRNKGDL